MANALYDKGRDAFLNGGINFTADTIKIALVKSTYTPNLSTHQFYSDVSAQVIGTPQTLSKGATSAGSANASANSNFTAVASGSTVNYVLIYKDTGTAGTSPLIALIDTATNLPLATNNGDVSIQWPSPIFTL